MSESDTAPHAFDEHAMRPYTGGDNPTAIEMDVNVQRTTEYPEGTVFETLKLKKDSKAGELRNADSYCLINDCEHTATRPILIFLRLDVVHLHVVGFRRWLRAIKCTSS